MYQAHGKFHTEKADNDVVAGIRRVAAALKEGRLKFHESCGDIIREFSLYRWSAKAGTDAPIKENDHAMDDMRYFVTAVTKEKSDDFFVISMKR